MNRRSILLLVLLCVCALLGPGCERSKGKVHLDRVQDLISLIGTTTFSDGSVYGERRVASISASDNRDALAYVQMPTGTSGTWAPLETHGTAILSFACGVAWYEDGVEDRPVRFRIEGRDEEATTDGDWQMLFDRIIRPSDLPDPDRYRRFEVQLPGTGRARWSLRFSTDLVDAGGERLVWPGWMSPRVESAGRVLPVEQHPLLTDRLVLDLIGGLGEATILRESESAPVARAALDAAVGIASAGGRRTCIRAATPTRIRYELVPPEDCRLRFAVGVDTDTGWKLPGDGMVFAVEVNGERIWENELNPRHVMKDRGWKQVNLDLSRWAGIPIELDLVTEERENDQNDIGGFANAVVLRRQEIERLVADEAPTILLVLVDTLRADRLGVYGNPAGLSPRLDAMARQGVFFSGARTVTSWTWPTVASVFTGLYPGTHGVHSGEGFYLIDGFETIAELFEQRGYSTGAFISSLLIGEPDNFHQGYETFVQTPYGNARAMNDRLLSWLDSTEGLARFAYVHYFDPHDPYLPPPDYLPERSEQEDGLTEEEIIEQVKQSYVEGAVDDELVARWMAMRWPLYDAEVRYFDEAFGELLDALEERGVLDNCVIAFTSDHGEEFYEHGLIDHGGHLYDETVQVPLWITGYGRAALTPRTVTQPTEIRNLLPTLCRLADVPLPSGASIGGDLLADTRQEAIFGQTCHGVEDGVKGWTDKFYVIRNGWKLIHTPANGRNELYHLDEDPLELSDQIGDERRIADALNRELKAWLEQMERDRTRARVEMDQEALRMMAELGYIAK